jgi:hypothetical protein
VWIEIMFIAQILLGNKSLPIRKCGLKFFNSPLLLVNDESHFPYGSVD